MARIKVAFDDANLGLGHYFNSSKQDIIDFIDQIDGGHEITEIPSNLCSRAYFDVTFPFPVDSPFLFIAYSHGKRDRLLSSQGAYIEARINTNRFGSSLFYSMACHTGLDLGSDLLIQNCQAFIGYIDEAWILHNYIDVSIQCDNFGIKEFLNGASIKESFDKMYENFTANIDKLEAEGDALSASWLRNTRDALVIKTNNPNIRFNEF